MEHTQEGAASRGYPDGNVAFANGEAAMYLQGPWALSEIREANPEVQVGTFPMPLTNNPEDTRSNVSASGLLQPDGSLNETVLRNRCRNFHPPMGDACGLLPSGDFIDGDESVPG